MRFGDSKKYGLPCTGRLTTPATTHHMSASSAYTQGAVFSSKSSLPGRAHQRHAGKPPDDYTGRKNLNQKQASNRRSWTLVCGFYILIEAMYSTVCTCPTAIRLFRSNLVVCMGPMFFIIWEKLLKIVMICHIVSAERRSVWGYV